MDRPDVIMDGLTGRARMDSTGGPRNRYGDQVLCARPGDHKIVGVRHQKEHAS